MPSPSALRRTVSTRIAALAASRWPLTAAVVIVLAAAGCLVAAMIPVGPEWLAPTGAVAVSTVYSWGLAAREGGRPVVFGTLALLIGLAAVFADQDLLRTGAAVLTATVAAVLGVMITVPTKGLWAAGREAVVGVTIAAVGAMASVGFEPTISVERYEYTTLGLGLIGVFVVVFRLGAGFHGLGKRGLVVVIVGAVVLSVTLLYAELLRRYGSSSTVDDLLEAVRWSRENLGAFPRPITTLLGVPALVYGCHLRARRRQGWWVSAFGVAATAPIATALGNPVITADEALLSIGFSLVIGILIGWIVVRLDLLLTGNRGRRRRVAEKLDAIRPEPKRTAALL